jgi:protocatechuate 3,4-dioxygenase beta subunit
MKKGRDSTKKWFKGLIFAGVIALTISLMSALSPGEEIFMKVSQKPEPACKPTQADALGPFYKPDAPVRSRVGDGYVLTGTVKSSATCSPVSGARIEFWLAGPNGQYDDNHRATVFSDSSGRYQFESNAPPPYSGRPSHIHIRVSAGGFDTLVTQHYPASGQGRAVFDPVLIPKK